MDTSITRQFSERESLRAKFILYCVAKTAPIYVRFFKRNKKAWRIDKEKLKKFPTSTLGYQLGNFLEKENLELMPCLEEHDVMHVLLGFKTTIEDEVAMQCLLIGNGKRSLYAFGTVLIGTILLPEHWRHFYQNYVKGKKLRNFSKWDFNHLLGEPTAIIRAMLSKEKIETPTLFI